MVNLIEQIHAVKEYRTETLFLAVSLMDKYLAILTIDNKSPPCLITLSVTCLLMAAKLAQPISPSFTRMISLLKQQNIDHIEKQHMIDLEESIIRTLDYNLQNVSAGDFVERYLRLFGLDDSESSEKKIS